MIYYLKNNTNKIYCKSINEYNVYESIKEGKRKLTMNVNIYIVFEMKLLIDFIHDYCSQSYKGNILENNE